MTANDIIGNLRIFVNCNKTIRGGGPKSIHMSKDTFDALCSIFQAAAWAQYPYDLGQSQGESVDAKIYGVRVEIDNNMKFGEVRMTDKTEHYKLLMGEF